MILLDKSAAAHARVFAACSVEQEEGTDNFCVRMHDGTVLHPGMSHDDATALLEQERGRSAIVAALREIISPDVLSRAAHHAGCTLRKFQDNEINQGRKPSLALLNGLLETLEEDSHDG